jgi:hypothetical protein
MWRRLGLSSFFKRKGEQKKKNNQQQDWLYQEYLLYNIVLCNLASMRSLISCYIDDDNTHQILA